MGGRLSPEGGSGRSVDDSTVAHGARRRAAALLAGACFILSTFVAAHAAVELRVEKGPGPDDVTLVTFTVDPERDTPAMLAQYVPQFHPSFLGLYGDLPATQQVAKDFKVFYEKHPGVRPGDGLRDFFELSPDRPCDDA